MMNSKTTTNNAMNTGNEGTKIRGLVAMPYHGFDAHSGATMLRAEASWMDPFLGIDSYVMPQPFFPPHPHAGMSAVTLMLPEADGGFTNRDSLGDLSEIRPGDLHWTQAGSGMMHEEIPSQPGKAARGMQVFVNLARKDKQSAPKAFHIKHELMPTVQLNDRASMRVVAGQYANNTSPISSESQWHTRVNMLDINLQANTHTAITIDPNHNVFFVMRSGSLIVDRQTLSANEQQSIAIFYEPGQTSIDLKSGNDSLRGVLFSGKPINEPVVSKGPFTGNTADDISAYIRRFQSGEMGRLSQSF
jgi:redox-sensitive bicupin YhaK (pirin superfamily)